MNAPDMVGPDGLFRRRKDSVNGIKLHSVVGEAVPSLPATGLGSDSPPIPLPHTAAFRLMNGAGKRGRFGSTSRKTNRMS